MRIDQLTSYEAIGRFFTRQDVLHFPVFIAAWKTGDNAGFHWYSKHGEGGTSRVFDKLRNEDWYECNSKGQKVAKEDYKRKLNTSRPWLNKMIKDMNMMLRNK